MSQEKQILDQISNSIRAAGYDPYAQLYGYYLSGNDSYITRQDNARNLIKSVDKSVLEVYFENMNLRKHK